MLYLSYFPFAIRHSSSCPPPRRAGVADGPDHADGRGTVPAGLVAEIDLDEEARLQVVGGEVGRLGGIVPRGTAGLAAGGLGGLRPLARLVLRGAESSLDLGRGRQINDDECVLVLGFAL